MSEVTFDEFGLGFSWVMDERMQRTSHALVDRGRVWLIDPIDVPHLEVPDVVPDSPFEAIPVVRIPGWRETALWWPEQRALVVAEIVGTNDYFAVGPGPVGIHPFLRAWPPSSLRGMQPEHLLTGHGAGVHGPEAAPGLEQAFARSRRDLLHLGPALVKQALGR